MKFIKAHQSVGSLAADIETYIQSGAFHANNLVVVTLEENKSDLKSMVSTEVKTVKKSDFEGNEPLNNLDIDLESVELYDDVLRSGGYVLFQKDAQKASSDDNLADNKENDRKSGEVELHAPGFGVDIDDPDSTAENHEDNFNPDNPNPQAGK